MAISRTFEELAERIRQIANRVQNSDEAVRVAAQAMAVVAVTTTPVDTGWCRSRWEITYDAPPQPDLTVNDQDIGEGAATSISLSLVQQGIDGWDGNGSMFLSNPVFYSTFLDNGSSVQAPTGMTDQAIAVGQQILREYRLLDES